MELASPGLTADLTSEVECHFHPWEAATIEKTAEIYHSVTCYLQRLEVCEESKGFA